jgi:AsmA protein
MDSPAYVGWRTDPPVRKRDDPRRNQRSIGRRRNAAARDVFGPGGCFATPATLSGSSMARSRRFFIFAVVGSVAVVALAAAALVLLVDASVYKSRLEAAASSALGMDVSFEGAVALRFLPGLNLTLEGVHVRNRDTEVVSAGQAALRIELLPLFSNEVRIERIALKRVTVSIERAHDGRFNVERAGTVPPSRPDFDVPNASVAELTFVYTDRAADAALEATGCHAEIRRLRVSGGEHSSLLTALSFAAEILCTSMHSGAFAMSELKFSADARNGLLDLQPLTARVFGAQGSGRVQANFSAALPRYEVNYTAAKFPIEDFFKAMAMPKVASGSMDFSAHLSMQGKTMQQIRQTLAGEIALHGTDLTLYGRDLDEQFSRYESSQNFNLFDVGAVVLAGPLGLVATRGYNFASLLQSTGGSSAIRTVVSDWKVDRGVAHATDVAIATKENRVAVQGGLDFANQRFDDVTMALVDANGCAKVKQKIHGTFKEPVVEKPGLLKSLTGPALSLLKKGGDLLGVQCDVFYAGSVAAPR